MRETRRALGVALVPGFRLAYGLLGGPAGEQGVRHQTNTRQGGVSSITQPSEQRSTKTIGASCCRARITSRSYKLYTSILKESRSTTVNADKREAGNRVYSCVMALYTGGLILDSKYMGRDLRALNLACTRALYTLQIYIYIYTQLNF